MAIPLLPSRTLTQVTPFTYRDGYTFLRILEETRDYLNRVIENANDLDDKIDTTVDDVNVWVTAVQTAINAAFDVLQGKVDDTAEYSDTVKAEIAEKIGQVIATLGDANAQMSQAVVDTLATVSQELNSAVSSFQVVLDNVANVTFSPGAAWNVVNTISDGKMNFHFTVPENDPTWWTTATLTASTDLNDVTAPGIHVLSVIPTDPAAQHLPASQRGVLMVMPFIGTASLLQTWTSWEDSVKVYSRYKASGVWGPWVASGSASTPLSATADFNTFINPGNYALAAIPADWAAQHMPTNSRGILTVLGMNTVNALVQEYVTWDVKPRKFARRLASGVWSDWVELGAVTPASVAPVAPSPAGFKLVGVPLTAGHFGSDSPLSGAVRMPLLYGTTIRRFRLRVQNINPRSGVTRNGSLSLSGIWLGTHTGNGAMSDVQQLMGAVSVSDSSTEWRSPWFNAEIPADTEMLLSFGYTASSAPWNMLGYSFRTDNLADASAPNPSGMARQGTVPYTIALEVEVAPNVPVIASIGDSNSVGVGATLGLHDSWLSRMCRRVGALPDHRGSSGDTMTASTASTSYKYTRFADLTKPDAVIFAMGQNDIAIDGQTLGSLQSLYATTVANTKAAISNNLYGITIAPRTTDPWVGFETLRASYNTFVTGRERDTFDFAAVLSDDDLMLKEEFAAADGIHWNADGNEAVNLSITRPVVASWHV